MKMPIFAILSKARLDTQSIKGSSLVAVRQTINFLDSGYILQQYMNVKHKLLYKTWTAGIRGRGRTRF
jgi:hypothetical protein